MTIGAKFVLREQFFIISAWEVLFRLRAGPEQQLSALKKAQQAVPSSSSSANNQL